MFNYCSENFNDDTCDWHTKMRDLYNSRYDEWVRSESKWIKTYNNDKMANRQQLNKIITTISKRYNIDIAKLEAIVSKNGSKITSKFA